MVRSNRRFRHRSHRPLHGLRGVAADALDHQPLAIAFGAFGAGLGMGVGLGLLIAETESFQKAEPGKMAGQIGEAVARLLPEALARHLQR